MNEKKIDMDSFIRDAVSLGFDVTQTDGEFRDPITTKAKRLWELQQQRNKANATFIQEYIRNPILEQKDGGFVAQKIKGMIEFNGQMVFVTSSTCLAYDMSLSVSEASKIKRIVF